MSPPDPIPRRSCYLIRSHHMRSGSGPDGATALPSRAPSPAAAAEAGLKGPSPLLPVHEGVQQAAAQNSWPYFLKEEFLLTNLPPHVRGQSRQVSDFYRNCQTPLHASEVTPTLSPHWPWVNPLLKPLR